MPDCTTYIPLSGSICCCSYLLSVNLTFHLVFLHFIFLSIRHTFGGLFLVAVLPPKCKKMFNFLYEYVLKRIATKFNGFTGFPVKWGDDEQKETIMKLRIVNDVQDVKGLPECCCCKTTGSYVGACPWCKLQGIADRNKAVYPSSVTFLPKVVTPSYGDRGVKVLICDVPTVLSYVLSFYLTFHHII